MIAVVCSILSQGWADRAGSLLQLLFEKTFIDDFTVWFHSQQSVRLRSARSGILIERPGSREISIIMITSWRFCSDKRFSDRDWVLSAQCSEIDCSELTVGSWERELPNVSGGMQPIPVTAWQSLVNISEPVLTLAFHDPSQDFGKSLQNWDKHRESKVGSARHDKYDQPSFFFHTKFNDLTRVSRNFYKLNQHWLVFTKLKQQGLVTSGVVCL